MNEMKSMKSMGAAKSAPSVKSIPEITGKENQKSKEEQEVERIAKIVFHETQALRPMVENKSLLATPDSQEASVKSLHTARRKIAGIAIEGKNRVAKGKYPDWNNKEDVYHWELCKQAVKEAVSPNGENHVFMLGSNDGGKTPRPKKKGEKLKDWPYDNTPTSTYGPFRNLYTKEEVPDSMVYLFFYTGPLKNPKQKRR